MIEDRLLDKRREYITAKRDLAELEREAQEIVDYLRQPRRSSFDEKMLLTTNEKVNSEYMKNLSQRIDERYDQIWNLRNLIPEKHVSREGVEIIIGEDPHYIQEELEMYAKYLEEIKNPEVLDPDELSRVTRTHLGKGYYLEMPDEQYHKIADNLDKIQESILPRVFVAPFIALGLFIRALKKS